jgi:hypothetical protein
MFPVSFGGMINEEEGYEGNVWFLIAGLCLLGGSLGDSVCPGDAYASAKGK